MGLRPNRAGTGGVTEAILVVVAGVRAQSFPRSELAYGHTSSVASIFHRAALVEIAGSSAAVEP